MNKRGLLFSILTILMMSSLLIYALQVSQHFKFQQGIESNFQYADAIKVLRIDIYNDFPELYGLGITINNTKLTISNYTMKNHSQTISTYRSFLSNFSQKININFSTSIASTPATILVNEKPLLLNSSHTILQKLNGIAAFGVVINITNCSGCNITQNSYKALGTNITATVIVYNNTNATPILNNQSMNLNLGAISSFNISNRTSPSQSRLLLSITFGNDTAIIFKNSTVINVEIKELNITLNETIRLEYGNLTVASYNKINFSGPIG